MISVSDSVERNQQLALELNEEGVNPAVYWVARLGLDESEFENDCSQFANSFNMVAQVLLGDFQAYITALYMTAFLQGAIWGSQFDSFISEDGEVNA